MPLLPSDRILKNREAKLELSRPVVKPVRHRLPDTPSSTFITCRLSQPSVNSLVARLTQTGCESIYFSESRHQGREGLEAKMKTRNAWNENLANIKNEIAMIKDGFNNPNPTPNNHNRRSTKSATATPNRKDNPFPARVSPVFTKSAIEQRQPFDTPARSNIVTIDPSSLTVSSYNPQLDATTSDTGASGGAVGQRDLHGAVLNWNRSQSTNKMSQPANRPSLKLKLSTTNFANSPSSQATPTAGSPNPQSAIRTPSIKLNLGKKTTIVAASPSVRSEKAETAPSSAKKRKRSKADDGSEDDASKPPPPQRRLTLKTSAAPSKTPVTPGPIFKLKTKGKIPKRPLGVGYDSELEDRESDPVILEGLILRMPPGPDCDYVQEAIRNGTIGIHRAQNGADIRIRCLDTNGRRGVMIVNGHQYATTVVDLPCIIEGMKSWDKKGWIKSIDICQMMLVLGTCSSDDEAKNYPLPSDVDPKTFAFAHGLTAPMKWVRKRRFARTRRARVDDIESIERKVNALLEADAKALSSRFQVFDHDPRIENQYSEVEDDYDDEDAEGEEDQDYFTNHNGYTVGTPSAMDVDAHVDQAQIDDIEAMFNDDEDDTAAPITNGQVAPKLNHISLLPPSARDTSVAITSASGSPSASAIATAAATPAENDQAGSSDDDEDEDEDVSDRSDSEKDADDNLQQVKDRIADMEHKIREQIELLKMTSNGILKKKLAKKITELNDDVRMMKVQNGLAEEGDGDGGDE